VRKKFTRTATLGKQHGKSKRAPAVTPLAQRTLRGISGGQVHHWSNVGR
jgi:hypothetical protein